MVDKDRCIYSVYYRTVDVSVMDRSANRTEHCTNAFPHLHKKYIAPDHFPTRWTAGVLKLSIGERHFTQRCWAITLSCYYESGPAERTDGQSKQGLRSTT